MNTMRRNQNSVTTWLALIIITAVFCLISPGTAEPAIGVDAVSTGTGTGTSITVSHTTSGTNRLMLVGISGSANNVAVSTVKYGGTDLSLVGTAAYSTYQKIWIYRLVAPATGTANVVVNFSMAPSHGSVVGVMTFTGVDQGTPLGTFAGASGWGTAVSVNVSSASGELVFDTISHYRVLTVGANQTQRWNMASSNIEAAGSTEPGAATVTMSWTANGTDGWAIGAVPIKPAQCSKPSPVPLGAIKHPAPANIMFVLDDSGSMDAEILTEGEVYGNDSTRVTISGWTTGPDNYIKIYTPTSTSEVGTSQRHNGTAGTGYRLISSGENEAITIQDEYVRIEGLEVSSYSDVIVVADVTADNDIRISHCLVHDTTGEDASGIYVNDADAVVYVWNNIGYNLDYGIVTGGASKIYAYNNTFVDNGQVAFAIGAGTCYAKNNLAANSIDRNYVDWDSGSFHSSSDYNWSDDTTDTGGANDINSGDAGWHDVTFVNRAGDNFHLASTDTGAINHGTDLSSDSNLSFSDDIDGHARESGNWDIGADECYTGAETWYTITATAGTGGSITPSGAISVSNGSDRSFTITADTGYLIADVVVDGSSVGAMTTYTFTNVTADHTISAAFSENGTAGATTLYRSVGTNPSNLNSDNRTVTISGSTATFSGSMSNNVGVGDVLTYSSGGNRLAFIHGRSSSTVFAVKNKDGGTPAAASPGTSVGVYRAYASLANWESQTENPNITEPTEDDVNPSKNLVSAGTVMMVVCYADANDYLYVFDDPGDHIFKERILGSTRRSLWKYQWSGYNKVYYDPSVTYEPWPGLLEANLDEPLSHPYYDNDNDINLNGTYINTLGVNIKNAHYYTYDDANGNGDYDTGEPVYLVVIEGVNPSYTLKYYLATISGGGATEEVTNLVAAASVPESVKSGRSAAEERQNFANWYSFYRRRHFTATAAVANTIDSMQGVNVGFYSINGSLIKTVLPVKVKGIDDTATLLNSLYSMTLTSDMSKPLRQGLEAVGRYFDKDDNIKLNGGTGDDSPYADAENGGACQQAFAIVITDGYWNGGAPSTGAIANNDGDGSSDYDGAAPHGDEPYGDSYSDTLADVAMYYYENDLSSGSSGLENSVTTNPADSASHQHMVTYTVGFGVDGNLIPAHYDFETGSYPTWPNPFDTDDPKYNKYRIDDLWHAAVNGRGEYLSVFNSGELVDALLAIKQNIESRIGSAAPVSVNGVELYEEVGPELFMFQSTYNSYGWTGDVKAYPVTPTTGEVSETPEWSAADELDAMDWTSRKIATYNPDTASGIPFQYTNFTATQKTYLNSDETNFLRGNRSLEKLNGGTFRNRFSVLGDIVHSSPVFENGVLYTGGNDGMLHAFSQTDGSEIFAYVPNLVFENLKNLAAPTYYWDHTFYVDLSPVIQRRVKLSTENEITLLVGGLGRGGKGYYALNITGIDKDTSFTNDSDVAGKVLWEFEDAADLGYSYARPAIVDSNDDDLNANATGWMVIAGNGYNSENGRAVLLIFDPSNGQLLKRIDTGVGSCNGLSTPVVIDVDDNDKVDYVYAGDLKGNLWKFDLTDPNYNNWGVAFGVDNSGDDSINYTEGDDPKPLFQAPGQPITTKPDVMRHPERHGYIVVFGTGMYLGASDLEDISLNTIYGIWDYGDDSDNSEYLGFFNRESATTKLSNQPDTVTLLEQQIIRDDENDSNFWTVGENKLRILTDNTPNWTTTTLDSGGSCGQGLGEQQCDPNGVGGNPDPIRNVGWYFDLPLTGERVVTDVMIRDAKAIVITFTPEEAPCSIGGDSIVHEMDAASGGRLLRAQFDIGGAPAIDSEDLIDIGGESGTVAPTGIQKTGRLHLPAILGMGSTEMKYFSSSEGTIKRVREKPPKVGVRYWRELE